LRLGSLAAARFIRTAMTTDCHLSRSTAMWSSQQIIAAYILAIAAVWFVVEIIIPERKK
jgi:hypothetical protein